MTTEFPREEAKLPALAKKMAHGLGANADLFPAPPFPAEGQGWQGEMDKTIARCFTPLRHGKG